MDVGGPLAANYRLQGLKFDVEDYIAGIYWLDKLLEISLG